MLVSVVEQIVGHHESLPLSWVVALMLMINGEHVSLVAAGDQDYFLFGCHLEDSGIAKHDTGYTEGTAIGLPSIKIRYMVRLEHCSLSIIY